MAASDDDDDSYVLPKVSSNDEGEDSEDKALDSIAMHVHDRGRKVGRDPARNPEAKAEVAPAAANPLPAAVAPILPVDTGAAEQIPKVMVKVVEQAGQQVMDEEEGEKGKVEVGCREGSMLGREVILWVEPTTV